MKITLFTQFVAVKAACCCLLLLLFSCSEDAPYSGIDRGVIEYTISYPDIPKNNYMLDLMPKKMETSFYKGNFRSDIVAGMGLFKTSIICEEGRNELVHSVKMLNKKYASTLNFEQILDFNPSFKNIEITVLEEKKDIAGYTCQAASVKVLGDSSWSFTVYYTNEINMPNSNRHTPFKSIDGVLLQYDILSYDVHMIFTAQKVIPIEDSINVKLEEGYEQVSPERLKKEIESIFATIK